MCSLGQPAKILQIKSMSVITSETFPLSVMQYMAFIVYSTSGCDDISHIQNNWHRDMGFCMIFIEYTL